MEDLRRAVQKSRQDQRRSTPKCIRGESQIGEHKPARGTKFDQPRTKGNEITDLRRTQHLEESISEESINPNHENNMESDMRAHEYRRTQTAAVIKEKIMK